MRSIMLLFALALAVSGPALATEIVPVPPFRSIELRGGGNVTVVPGPAQRITITDGSTQFTRMHVERDGQLKIDTCNDRCPHLYRLHIRIEAPQVPDRGISGGGAISVQPGFRSQSQLSVAVNGGGEIDTRGVDAADVSAAVNGGGDIAVRARSALSAAVQGGGVIRYLGNPQVSTAISGGGHVGPGR
jgi:putative autotransporter adhesin-like protein